MLFTLLVLVSDPGRPTQLARIFGIGPYTKLKTVATGGAKIAVEDITVNDNFTCYAGKKINVIHRVTRRAPVVTPLSFIGIGLSKIGKKQVDFSQFIIAFSGTR